MQKTILYVDDNSDDLLLFRGACEVAKVGFRLITLDSGPDALRYFSGLWPYSDRAQYPEPDVALIDIKMAEVDGFGVLRWMREHEATRQTPAILYSSSVMPADGARARELDGLFITKPTGLAGIVELAKGLDEWLATGSRAKVEKLAADSRR